MARPWDNKPDGRMTAAVLRKPGATPASACFTIDSQFPKPTLPGPDWILVKVRVAGLNRAELRGRNGDPPGRGEFNIWQRFYTETPPMILGEEFVGTVEIAGSATTFHTGELVTGFIYGGGKAHDGAYAQYTLCHKRRLYRLRASTKLPWDVLGAIPMSLWTAYGSIFEAGELRRGQTLLVHGGTSSVGVFAILLAKSKGCTVVATTRQEAKLERLKTTGADFVFSEKELEKGLKQHFPAGVDVVLELVGPNALVPFTFRHLARHGTAVCTGMLDKGWALEGFRPSMIPPTRKLTFYGMTNRGSAGSEDEGLEEVVEEILADAVAKVETGVWKKEMFLDRVFDLADVGKAHEYMEENRAVGKVVVMIPE